MKSIGGALEVKGKKMGLKIGEKIYKEKINKFLDNTSDVLQKDDEETGPHRYKRE